MLEEELEILQKVENNYYWLEAFQQLIQIITKFIDSGTHCALMVLKNTKLVQGILNSTIENPENFGAHFQKREIFFDVMNLI